MFGLQPKSSFVRFFHKLGTVETPEKLLKNVKVIKWELSNTSLHVQMHVKTDRKKQKKILGKRKKPTSTTLENTDEQLPEGWENFQLRVKQFPSEVDSEASHMTVSSVR